jgi:hypothetical protein
LEVDGEKTHSIKTKLHALVSRSPSRARWTRDAEKRFSDFYADLKAQRPQGLVDAATKRIHVYVRKLAMAYARLENTVPEVLDEQLEAAIAVGRYGVEC